MFDEEPIADVTSHADNSEQGSGAGPASAIRFRSPRRRRFVMGVVFLLFLVSLLVWHRWGSYDTLVAVCFGPPQSPDPPAPGAQFAQSGFRGWVAFPFDLSNATVPADEIRSGGPPKDGIPALTNPRLIAAEDVTYLRSNDRVIGFANGQEARAYPLKILSYHEVVNDRIGDLPLAITYCPLCDSAAAFDRRTPLGEREFGVSGLLYNSNVLMYDRGGPTESLWSQLKTESVSGPAVRTSLTPLPLELTTWESWRSRHPNTKVLSTHTGHRRDYSSNPYTGYFARENLMFPVRPRSNRLPAKVRVLGVWTEKAARAYPLSAFTDGQNRVEDRLAGKRVVVELEPDARSLRVVEADEGVHWMYSFWFAWYAFYPETTVFEPSRERSAN